MPEVAQREIVYDVSVNLRGGKTVLFRGLSFSLMNNIIDQIANRGYYRATRTLIMSQHVTNISAVERYTDA